MPIPVAIQGVPRSGTSWLGQIFNSSPDVAYRYQPLFSYAFKNRLAENSCRRDIDRFLVDLLATDDEFILQTGSKALSSKELRFQKAALPNYLVFKEVRYHNLLPMLMAEHVGIQLVAIVRDPREVLQSWRAAPREFRPEWSFAEEWKRAASKNRGRAEEFFGFEGWLRATLIFQRLQAEYPGRVRILKYHALKAQPQQQVQEMFLSLQLPMSDQTRQFLKKSTTTGSNADTYGVFRNHSKQNVRDALPYEITSSVIAECEECGLSHYLDPDFSD